MIPEITILRAFAALLAMGGIAFVINGLRYSFLDEVAIGTVLLLIGWWIIG